MEIIHQHGAGIDVHKKQVTVCALWSDEHGQLHKEIRTFSTMTAELLQLADWLVSLGVSQLAMESTGVYWKPVWNVLEGLFAMLLVNARDIKTVPGRKTDVKDCEWIAQLLRHGLLRASFVPEPQIRDLRELTRLRARTVQELSRIANRIQKVLEDANLKLAAVASDPLGVSARAILKALAAGQADPKALAQLAKARLRNKIPELEQALVGRVREHHRWLLGELLRQLEETEGAIARLEERIEWLVGQGPLEPPPQGPESGHAREEEPEPEAPGADPAEGAATAGGARVVQVQPFLQSPLERALARWMSIPGIDRTVALALAAEIGVKMEQFPTARHLASWAGMCPGCNESAGKRKSGKTGEGSPWLKRVLNQAAWAASRSKGTYLAAQYHRLAARRGKKRAITAVGHSILVIAWHLQKRGVTYEELGADWFDKLNLEGSKRYHIRRLEKLGFKVSIEPAAVGA
jgi:transposase